MQSSLPVLAGILAMLFMVACGSSGSGQGSDVPGEALPSARVAPKALTVGRWRVRVTVNPSRLGPIAFAAKNLVRAERGNSHPWIEHDLVFRNTGARAVTFADTRSSAFLGQGTERRLLAADEGCGWAQDSPKAPARAGACRASLELIGVRPHASVKRSITLFWGLPGMNKLEAGRYMFRRPVRFQLGDRPPGKGQGHSEVLNLVYEVEARTE
jgi:hypothetical protein